MPSPVRGNTRGNSNFQRVSTTGERSQSSERRPSVGRRRPSGSEVLPNQNLSASGLGGSMNPASASSSQNAANRHSPVGYAAASSGTAAVVVAGRAPPHTAAALPEGQRGRRGNGSIIHYNRPSADAAAAAPSGGGGGGGGGVAQLAVEAVQAVQARQERQNARSQRQRERENMIARPEPQVLTEPPQLLSSTLLSEHWTYPFWSYESFSLDQLLCARCHVWRQSTVLNPSWVSSCLLPFVWFVDFISLGCPTGIFYPGLGSATLGCYVRVQIRLKYRIQSNGVSDIWESFCCAHLSTTQQQRELEKEGVEYTVPMQDILTWNKIE